MAPSQRKHRCSVDLLFHATAGGINTYKFVETDVGKDGERTSPRWTCQLLLMVRDAKNLCSEQRPSVASADLERKDCVHADAGHVLRSRNFSVTVK